MGQKLQTPPKYRPGTQELLKNEGAAPSEPEDQSIATRAPNDPKSADRECHIEEAYVRRLAGGHENVNEPESEIGGAEKNLTGEVGKGDNTGTAGKRTTTLLLPEERRKLLRRRKPALALLIRHTLVKNVLLIRRLGYVKTVTKQKVAKEDDDSQKAAAVFDKSKEAVREDHCADERST